MRRPSDTGRRVARLGDAAVTILESVYQHRLLSTVQIRELHAPATSDRWTRKLLGRLRDAGLIAVTRAPGGLGLWYVTAHGADAVELIGGRSEQRRRVLRPSRRPGRSNRTPSASTTSGSRSSGPLASTRTSAARSRGTTRSRTRSGRRRVVAGASS